MRYGRLFGSAAVLSTFFVALASAADFGGTYRSPDVTLQLAPAADGYRGTLQLKGTSYPVTAKEAGGALEGAFVAAGASFEFRAQLAGDALTLKSGRNTFELKRDAPPQPDKPANPLDQLAAPAGQGPPTQPASASSTPATQPVSAASTTRPAAPVVGDPAATAAAVKAIRDLGPAQPDPKRDWLVLVYMDGDNNLELQGAFNIDQMERGLPDAGVDVLVLYDRPGGKTKDGQPKGPRLYRVGKDKQPGAIDSPVLRELGPMNMADPALLAAFVEGAVKTFPARQHAIFGWDHGGGWQNMNHDEHAPGKPGGEDLMSTPAFRAGLEGGMKAAGLKKWDLLALDMCLMGQIEVAAEVRGLADVLVASEELVPGKGMPYDRVLQSFGKGTMGGRRIGADIVTAFNEFHKEDEQRSTTLAALDLRQFDEVNARLNALCDKLAPTLGKNWAALAKSYFYAEQYGASRDDFRKGARALQSVDLLDALKKCRAATADFPAEAEYADVVAAMDRFVIGNANSQRRRMSNGVAVYAPVIKSAYNPEYEQLAFYKVSRWPKLLQALYPEQARNHKAPTFGKIGLVDNDGKPAAAVKPLAGYGMSIEVDGTNIVWVRDMPGVRDPAFPGCVRVLASSYVVDANFLQKLAKGVENFGQDVDLIMPQLADGPNKLLQPQLGLILLMTNGPETVQVMVDNSDLRDPTRFVVLAEVQDPRLGDKPVRAQIRGDVVTLAASQVVLNQELPDGRVLLREFEPAAETKVTPLFLLLKDDGTRALGSKGSLAWGKGLTFTMDLLPAGDYEEVLVAETMTGASTTARFPFRAETDEQLVAAKGAWRGFDPRTMHGTWEWVLPTNPPRPMGWTLTVEPGKGPLAYQASVDVLGDGGKHTVTKGLLYLQLEHQPFFRLVMFPGKGQPVAMIGPIVWAPENGTPVIRSRNLALNINVYWLKKGGGKGPDVDPGPNPGPQPRPDGWVVAADANRAVSLAVPPSFNVNPAVIQRGQMVFRGYDFNALDPNLMAGVEIIRFDGQNDTDQVLGNLLGGARQLGNFVQVGPPQQTTIGGVKCVSYVGQVASGGAVYNVGLNLIPTPRGIVAVNFAVSAQTAEATLPLLQKIAATIEVAR